MSNTLLQINEVANRAAVSIRAVRYYEERGLLSPSNHTSGGIRLYNLRDVTRLIFIRRLKTMGLTLDEVKLCLGQLPNAPNRRLRVENTLRLLEKQKERAKEEKAKLAQLERDINASIDLVSRCLECGTTPCPEECSSYGQVL